MKRKLVMVDIEKAVETWQRMGGPPRYVRWAGEHPVLAGLILTLAMLLWMGPMLPLLWQEKLALAVAVVMVLMFGVLFFTLAKAGRPALQAFDTRTTAMQPIPVDNEEQRWRKAMGNLALLAGAGGGFVLGSLYLLTTMEPPSPTWLSSLWSGITYVTLGLICAAVLIRRRPFRRR